MKKIASMLLIVVLAFSVIAFTETTVDVDWNVFGGGISVDFQADNDAFAGLETAGSHVWGNFSGTDSDNNPYNYGVDDTTTEVKANFVGGYIDYNMQRQDSKTSMYGPAGQSSATYIESSDSGSFASRITTNFAGMRNCNYGFQSSNQWTASGDFLIQNYINAGDPLSGAGFNAMGSGSVNVSLMSSEASGSSSWNLGQGCGSYTNANANGTGSGSFNIYGQAPNQINAFGATVGGGLVGLTINYNNGFDTGNNLNMSGD
jgi:hypothetical protein